MLTNTMNLLSWKSNSLDKVTHVKIHLILCQVLSGLPRPTIGKLDLQLIGSNPDFYMKSYFTDWFLKWSYIGRRTLTKRFLMHLKMLSGMWIKARSSNSSFCDFGCTWNLGVGLGLELDNIKWDSEPEWQRSGAGIKRGIKTRSN